MQKADTCPPHHVGRSMRLLSANLAPLLTSETKKQALIITCFDREVWCRGNTTDICKQGAWFKPRLAILPRIYRDGTFIPHRYILRFIIPLCVGRDSSVGIATRYGLDGLGIESRWGRDFPHPSRPALGPTQPLIQWVPGLSREQSGRVVALIIHTI